MTPDEFLKAFEAATNSHDFEDVRPLIAPDAVYFFSNQSLYGIEAIGRAFRHNFDTIRDETYAIRGVRWLAVSDAVAVCIYDFHWRGTIAGETREGSGRGTNALVKREGRWVMIHEHLSKPAEPPAGEG